MTSSPTLLYLHGIGKEDQGEPWRSALDSSLRAVGYPGLSEVRVVAPKYPNGLHGVDDDLPLPKVTVRALRGDEQARHRREFARRRAAMEVLLGTEHVGVTVPGAEHAIGLGAAVRAQAKNYVHTPRVRAWVLQRILDHLGEPERVVIVGHSLGSVIAADLLRRLPPHVHVVGMVTIGSPLPHSTFHVDRLPSLLEEPPANLAWWVNIWNLTDPIPLFRGVSAVIPWVLDQRIGTPNPKTAHDAVTYLANECVAMAIGRGLFGSMSRELVHVPAGSEGRPGTAETLALLGLRFAHLTLRELDGEVRARYAEGLRQVQAHTVHRVVEATDHPATRAIRMLTVDLTDPDSPTPEPVTPSDLMLSDVVVPLVAIATTNVLQPFDIEVSSTKRRRAMEHLAAEIGLESKVGRYVLDAVEEARDALDGPTNWFRWTAVGLGVAAMAVATGGLIFAAAPGLAGAAAITSALAAFGPGGMIGGLLTAGALVTAGGGSIAVGLAGVGTSAATVEAVVTTQLASAILRDKLNLPQESETWEGFTALERELARELARLAAVSDSDALSLKELRRKQTTVTRAIAYLIEHGLGASEMLELTTGDE